MSVTGPFEDQPGFAAAHMYHLYGEDAATATAVLEEYLLELPKDLKLMRENFEQSRYRELFSNLHKIKPGFLYVGLHDLYQHVVQLEALCTADKTGVTTQQEFPTLLREIACSEKIITKAIHDLKLHC